MLKHLFLPFAIVFSTSLSGQVQLKGLVKDATSTEALPYVNIGIRHKNLGTVSNEKGEFSITIPDQYLNDTLLFSTVGYNERYVPVAEIRGTGIHISLTPKQLQLEEVSISTKRLSENKYGLKHNPLLHFTDASTNQDDVFEIAQLIRLGKETSKITSLNLLINYPRQDSGTFRINFYKFVAGKPAGRIIEKSIVQKHAIKPGWLRFDLSAHNIYLKGEVVAAIEFLPSVNNSGPIVYEIKPAGRMKGFVRAKSLGTWQIPPHRYRMFVTALGVEKPDQAEEESEQERQPAFRVFSEAVNDSFSIFVKLPPGYLQEERKNYKTVYLLDANLFFGFLADSLEKRNDEHLILIGIGYKNLIEMDSLRNRDYTYPVALLADSFTVSGGGSKLYNFITGELIPYIDNAYRTDKTSRQLMGHSLGGYFTLFALYRDLTGEQSYFQSYVSASPSLDYGGDYLTSKFRETRSNINQIQRSVYISWGSFEDDGDDTRKYSRTINHFLRELSDRNFDGLQVKTRFYPHAGHMETAVPSFHEGLGRN